MCQSGCEDINIKPYIHIQHDFRHHTYVLSNGTLVRRSISPQHPTKAPPNALPNSVQHHSADAAAAQHQSMMHFNLTVMNRMIRANKHIQKRKPMDDLLSKNISFLLENLLKRYENSHLPTHGQGVCVCERF